VPTSGSGHVAGEALLDLLAVDLQVQDAVQRLDGGLPRLGSEVRVARRALDGLVAEDL
jgi:hypothetical protein